MLKPRLRVVGGVTQRDVPIVDVRCFLSGWVADARGYDLIYGSTEVGRHQQVSPDCFFGTCNPAKQ
jgi:hypothetical protein